jgi:uncharacterized membrane protein
MVETSTLAFAIPALESAFLTSLVEVVEGLTIVFAISTLKGWMPTFFGAVCALLLLICLILFCGPLLTKAPVHYLQTLVGVLVLLLGMEALRKAILRFAGTSSRDDESIVLNFKNTTFQSNTHPRRALSKWAGAAAAFKVVLLEGVEIAFIVAAVGLVNHGHFLSAALGAIASCLLILIVWLCVRKRIAPASDNALTFCVGAILSAFGVLWTGQGIGVWWPSDDISLLSLVCLFFGTALLTASTLGAAIEGRAE